MHDQLLGEDVERPQKMKNFQSTNGKVDIVSSVPNARKQQRTPKRLELWLVAKNGNVNEVERQLSTRMVDPNEEDFFGRTALWWAACQGQAEIVELLLATPNVNINARDVNGVTPLHVAVNESRAAVVKLLVAEQGLDIDCPSLERHEMAATPLHIAIFRQLHEVVLLLLSHSGIAINRQDSLGNTPLHIAVTHPRPSMAIVELLLAQEDIDVNLANFKGTQPLTSAVLRGHSELVSALLNARNFERDRANDMLLQEAAHNGYAEVVVTILRHFKEHLNSQDVDGQTPLHVAAEFGYESVVKVLLDTPGIEMRLENDEGFTPLFLAFNKEYENVVELFLERDGVSSRTASSYKQQLLSYAVRHGESKVVEKLLHGEARSNEEVDASDGDKRTLMWLAAANNDEGMIRALARWDRVTLHLLTANGELSLVKVLLAAGYSVDKPNDRGETALHIAVSCKHLDIAKELILWRANINAHDQHGVSPIQIALSQKSHDFIELLLEKSAETEGFIARAWLEAYDRDASDVLRLAERPNGSQNIGFVREGDRKQEVATHGAERRLYVIAQDSSWWDDLFSKSTVRLHRNRVQVSSPSSSTPRSMTFSVALWSPAGDSQTDGKYFKLRNEGQCKIAWTTAAAWGTDESTGPTSIDHFSTLPNGWIPHDGPDFLTQLIKHLSIQWNNLCDNAEDHLAECRLDQLQAQGKRRELILRFAQDAQTWSDLRTTWIAQRRTLEEFASEYYFRHNNHGRSRTLENRIKAIDGPVLQRIERLNQAVRDILQLEFAWVSINEAHHSTSLATSMKRLSWVTFIFLPAMFASSLFGMNVNILANNPDWRWALLVAGVCLGSTMCAWLLFKFSKIESWLDDHIGRRLHTATNTAQGEIGPKRSRVPSGLLA